VPPEWLDTALACTSCSEEYDQDLDECPACGHPDADVVERGSVGRFWRLSRSAPRARHPDKSRRPWESPPGRIARRWYRAKGLTKQITVERVERSTGRVYYRRSRVRKELFAHRRGFLCVNDGAAFASQLARALKPLSAAGRRGGRHNPTQRNSPVPCSDA
jgi:hypothetical protein